jgi:hypothetical protein
MEISAGNGADGCGGVDDPQQLEVLEQKQLGVKIKVRGAGPAQQKTEQYPEKQEYRHRHTWRGQKMVSYEVLRSGGEGPDDQQAREALMDKRYSNRNMTRRDTQPASGRHRQSARAG